MALNKNTGYKELEQDDLDNRVPSQICLMTTI